MNLHGLSDSLAGLSREPEPCPKCGNTARVQRGGCLSCLLASGLEESDGSLEDFDAVLEEVEIPDREWRLGNYLILEELGRGGMGVIYRARQRHSKRVVALKRVLSYHGDSRDTLERFRREAQAAASLDHPNILPIYEVGEHEGLPFFTMKLAAGGSLQAAGAVLRAHPRECVRLLAKVARAVACAHRAGILHRDLKPGNILLDGYGEPLVTDFGLAKWIDMGSDLTRSLAIFGTPGFIAPEQAGGPSEMASPAADVYSLGAILFDLLTGRAPFLGEHALAVIRQAAEKAAPKLRSLVPQADRDLETICAKCLEREPAARYSSASDLADDLEAWLEGRSIRARRVLLPVHAWRWSRRNRKLAITAATCVVFLCTSLIWWSQHQKLEKRVRAEQTIAHSFGVLPFLNLDTAGPEFGLAQEVAAVLGSQIGSLGPGRIDAITELPVKWTGIGTADEIRDAAAILKSRGLVTGTVRRTERGLRLSLHLIHERGARPLERWIVDLDSPEQLGTALRSRGIAAEMYRSIEIDPNDTTKGGAADPGLADDRARELIMAGRWLIDRGRASVADMDRAIECLQSAVQMQPKSGVARAYLAMACMGRDVNSPDQNLAARALSEAREAVRLAPHEETVNRALRIISATNGHYREALELALTALESTSSTERTFGQIAYFWNVLGRPDYAITWYERAKATGQQLADYDALLGDCWLNLGMLSAAEEHYRSAMKLRSDLPDGAVGLSRLHLLKGDSAAARNLCEQTVKEYSNSPHPKMMLAQIEFLARNFPEASKLYRDLYRANPTGGIRGEFYGGIDHASALARLEFERGNSVAAEGLLQRAATAAERQLAEAPQSAPALYRSAAIAALLGDKPRALDLLEAAIANGWVNWRTSRLDPRFDSVAADPRFDLALSSLQERLGQLREQRIDLARTAPTRGN